MKRNITDLGLLTRKTSFSYSLRHEATPSPAPSLCNLRSSLLRFQYKLELKISNQKGLGMVRHWTVSQLILNRLSLDFFKDNLEKIPILEPDDHENF